MLFELRDVSLRRAGRLVLDSISASLPAGATTIVGPSGCGKSTLLRLLNRLADPSSGTLAYRQRALTEYDPLQLRREVSLVPQLPALLNGTATDNLEYAARLAGVDGDLHRFLEHAGLPASIGDRDVSQLSVGEQQRVMLARALAQSPRVLLLDEPTAALDEASRDAVEQTLQRLCRQLEISLVVVSHDLDQARRLGDWVLRIEAGRVRRCGPVEQVIA
jgi:putative ABC transport system ATP-binding protein